MRLAYVAAMSGLAETVENAAKFLSRNDLKGLRKHLEEADVVHRGGQCPGIIVRGQIAVMLPRYQSRWKQDCNIAIRLHELLCRSQAAPSFMQSDV